MSSLKTHQKPNLLITVEAFVDFAPKNSDDIVGKTYLVEYHYEDFGVTRLLREVYRVDGYEVCKNDHNWGKETLTPRGFMASHKIYDRVPNPPHNHIYAYEETIVYKTFKQAYNVATKHNADVSLIIVQCCYDSRREPHHTFDVKQTFKGYKITPL
jgi:hypothetical protein